MVFGLKGCVPAQTNKKQAGLQLLMNMLQSQPSQLLTELDDSDFIASNIATKRDVFLQKNVKVIALQCKNKRSEANDGWMCDLAELV